ncbi:hypothetical protein QQX98_008647 [Neonectria punicea]|uniref:Uncharacterized protein n=1 Tax=Neonectria punicea TaxID=979145 RepID=A0ABR1GUQ2_9HYPO
MGAYDPLVFDGLPAVDIAATKVKSQDGDHLVKTAIRDLFIKHNVRDKIGVALVHRHFDLRSDEIMVDYQGVATPWSAGVLNQYDGFGRILPLSYVVFDGKLHPYEFYFTADSSEQPLDVPPELIADWEDLMKHNELGGLLGIRALRKEASTSHMMEFTQRFATFTVPWEGKPSSPSSGVYQTCWSFRLNEKGDEEPNDYCSGTHRNCDHSAISCFHGYPPGPIGMSVHNTPDTWST